jgi:hypothetical protein
VGRVGGEAGEEAAARVGQGLDVAQAQLGRGLEGQPPAFRSAYDDDTRNDLIDYLLDNQTDEGGFRANTRIPVADVLAQYGADIAPTHSRPKETAQRIHRLLGFFGDKMLIEVNGDLCRSFMALRTTRTAARNDLETLRAAINHHRRL